jgi:glycosyltransferase involved in cell wall biosynthesis
MIIILYIPSIDRIAGGTSTYMQSLSKELGRLCKLHIVTSLTSNALDLENAHIHYVNGSSFHLLKFSNEWSSLLDLIKPDVVNVNCCWMPQCAIAQEIAQSKGYKVVLTTHGMLDPSIINRHHFSRKVPALILYQKNAIKKADLIHTTASREKDNIIKLGWNNRIKNIPTGINIDEIAFSKNWEIKRKIISLSRIHPQKGIDLFIDVVSEIKVKLNDYQIIIAGEGEKSYIDSLNTKISRLNLQNIFRFVGGVYGDDKWNLYKNVDFFVLPTQSENFGLSIAESLASGTPVITTKGAPWEDLNTYNCGMWIERSKEELKKAILQMISLDSLSLQKMGENGRKLIEDKYSSKMMATRMMAMYHDIVEL